MDLTITNNNTSNPLTLDLTNYIQVSDKSMDPASPSFTDKVITHSLLKAGGVLALTDLKNKELVYPLLLMANTQIALDQLVEQINLILEFAGATASWQDDGASQATTFDLIGGQFDIEYDYRKAQKFYVEGKLRLFAEPFGRTASPRFYAAASGIGPLLMISPYTSAGASGIGATTVGGVAGAGGQPAGPSTGIFYASPGLQGDAPAVLQLSYAGPQPTGATNAGAIPYMAMSVLPDNTYQPLITPGLINRLTAYAINSTSVVGSQYLSVPPGASDVLSFQWPGLIPPTTWAGNHRVFAIARASAGHRDPGAPAILTRAGVRVRDRSGRGLEPLRPRRRLDRREHATAAGRERPGLPGSAARSTSPLRDAAGLLDLVRESTSAHGISIRVTALSDRELVLARPRQRACRGASC